MRHVREQQAQVHAKSGNARKDRTWSGRHGQQLTAFLFLLPAVIAFLVFKYLPIMEGFFISLFRIDIVDLPGEFCGAENYLRVFRDPEFYAALTHNIYFWIVGLLINFWPPIVLALLINEVIKHTTFFRMAYFIPAVAPAIAVTILWKYIWQPDYGLANFLLSRLGIEGQGWLNDPDWVYWCMYFPGLIISGGMNMLIYLAAMQEVPEEQYESALMDGAGFISRVRYILLPHIMPIIGTMFILDMINRFNEVNTPLVMTGGGPIGKTQTLILYAYKLAIDRQDYSYAIAIANVVFLLIFVITAIQMLLERKK